MPRKAAVVKNRIESSSTVESDATHEPSLDAQVDNGHEEITPTGPRRSVRARVSKSLSSGASLGSPAPKPAVKVPKKVTNAENGGSSLSLSGSDSGLSEVEVSEDDIVDSSDDEVAKPTSKSRNTKSNAATRANTPKPKKPRVSKKKTTAVPPEGSLFDIVSNHEDAIEAQISDWIADYNENKVTAMVELINFLIESCGCSGRVDASVFEDQDSITERLTELQEQIEAQPHSEYPIVAKGRGRGGNKFRKHFGDFWSKWISRLKHNFLFGDDGWCFETVVVWLVAMSSSVFRPFRHTATATALVLLTGLCDIGKQILDELTVAKRQLAAETKTAKSRVTPKQQQLDGRVQTLHDKKVKVETFMDDLFDSVFVHRYRDSEAIIRMECIRELGSWILHLPETYLSPQYLRYLGWMLSDKNGQVRLEALSSLSRLYAVESMVSGLREFTERFKPRIMQMAIREADLQVRSQAVHCVTFISQSGFLEDDDTRSLMPLIFDEDAKIRVGLSKLVQEIYTEEYLQAKKDELRTLGDNAVPIGAQDKWVEIKALCSMFVEFGEMLAENEKEVQKQQSPGAASATQTQSQSLVYATESQQLMSQEGDDDDLTEEELEERAQRLADLKGFLQWVCKDDTGSAAGPDAIGYKKVEAAVAALWNHIDVVQDWQGMCEYLSHDLTKGTGDTQSQNLDSTQHPLQLTDNEETCLVYLINAVISRFLQIHADEAATGTKKKAAGDKEDSRSEVSRGLIKHLPNMINKYGFDYTSGGQKRAAEIAILVRHVDVGLYLEMRMLKAYDSMFDSVKKLFMKQFSREVLTECAQTLRHLSGEGSGDGLDTNGSSVLQNGTDDAAAASVRNSATQKVEELAEDVINNQLAEALRTLETAMSDQVEVGMDTLYSLRNSLRRASQLSKVMGLGGMTKLFEAKNDSEWRGLFDLLHAVLNVCLAAATKQPMVDKTAEDGENLNLVLDDILETALNVMCYDVGWELREAFSKAVAATDEDGDQEETDKAIPPVEPGLAKDLLCGHEEKSSKLLPLAEAIVAGSEEMINFSIGVRLTAFQVLTYMYRMVNGDAAFAFPQIRKLPPDDVQAASVALIGGVADALCRDARALYLNDVNAKEAGFPVLNEVQKETARFEMSRFAAALSELLLMGSYDPQHAVVLCKYYGLEDSDAQLAAMQPFGTLWNGVTDVCLKHLLVDQMADAVGEVLEKGEESKQGRLKKFRATVRGMADVVFDGLVQATDLYLRSIVATPDNALTLAKVLITHLKTWLSTVKSTADLKTTHGIVVETLLGLLKRGGDEMILRVQEWGVVHEGVERDDMDFVRPRDVRAELGKVNEAWKVWGAIGGAVQQIVLELGMLKRPKADKDEETIDNVEDVVGHISSSLLEKGFKPVETDKEWAGYWTFVKALEKGDSTVRRRGRKAKVVASRDNSPARKAKGKRGRPAAKKKTVKQAAQDDEDTETGTRPNKKAKRGRPSAKKLTKQKDNEEDDEDDAGTPARAPQRRSARASVSAKKNYREAEDEEAEEEEVLEASGSEPADGGGALAGGLDVTLDTSDIFKGMPNAMSTPLSTYKHRHNPNSARSVGSRLSSVHVQDDIDDEEEEDDEPTPKAKPVKTGKAAGPKAKKPPPPPPSDDDISDEDSADPTTDGKQTENRAFRPVAAARVPAKRTRSDTQTPPPRNRRGAAGVDTGSSGDKENTNGDESETGFVSSPEIRGPKKRIRI
ncbi:uncharacterized protein EV422DRAFT_181064 [Fimicolochytrium jonesii]|uniref:uncharacterized protein n=1 Tax=Fimicolochytrium jonesii TaxID=1396493 RepID=UPI0022FE5C96|nr:uncharacterized protein EV422DRAFT_181064 [Fimicolochytrium jonesii]KAI8818342.1 hypothetical protein EV422DRAFT_181064 [Fimicolochytrium jonesii]